MQKKTEISIQEHRITSLKLKYFEKIKAYRQAARNPNIFGNETIKMLFNDAEQAFKAVGFEFGDDGFKGY